MFAWADFLDLADDLATRTGDEAAERSAISRAYYAVFGSARDHLSRSGVGLPQAGAAHAIVWTRFHAGPASVHRRIGTVGRRLLRRRRRADYDIAYPRLTREARESVELARRLLADLASLP